jgi:uncharacterized protein YacL
MNTKRIFSLLLALFGEALLIFCFLHFGKNVQSEILTLNIIVSTIIYCLVFVDALLPWINLKDKTQKQIGSIGLRWFFTFFYLILAISVMIIFNSVKPIHFTNQIIIHGILFFLLLLGLFMALSSSDKVREVYFEEKQNRDRIDEMKKVTKELQLKLDAMNDIPAEIVNRINELQENLRYLSPSNSSDSLGLESKFVEEMRVLSSCFVDNPLNFEKIISNIKNCERTYKERKQVFSN